MNGSQTQQGSFSTLMVLHYAFIGFIFVAGFVAYELVNAKKSTVLLNDDQQSILTILMVMAISIFSISWFVPSVKKIRSGIEVDQDGKVSDADLNVFIYSRAAFEFVTILGMVATVISGNMNFIFITGFLSLVLYIGHTPKKA